MSELRAKIAACCKRLRLRQMTDNLDRVSEADPESFLLRLLELEVQHRDRARVERGIRTAGFYTPKSLAVFLFDEESFPAQLSRQQLTELQFIRNLQNLILYGNVGTGKTHLAAALDIEACKCDFKVGFWRTTALVNHLSQLNDGGDLHGFLKRLEKLDLLICDEWGYVPVSSDGAQMLFQVVSACYEKHSMIIIKNLEFGRQVNTFLDQTMTTALIDRLVYHSHLLIFDGESHRVRDPLMRR